MITSIELQVISKILTTESLPEIDELCSLDESYYSIFKPQIHFILEHREKYGEVPDLFTFQSQFPDIQLVKVSEPIAYLESEMRLNKQHIILLETFNKLKDLGSGDTAAAWKYISAQCDRVAELEETKPLDLVKDAKQRADQVLEYSKQTRIPTGFPEIDKLMYGGFSTIEELVLIIARTNTGKSWMCVKMMESAQKNGFPVAYYSPEMQASYLGTRFDTWREHFTNSELFQGKYTDQYLKYISNLSESNTSAYIIENKDMEDDEVRVSNLRNFVRKHGIKLLIIDGLSYMTDDHRSDTDYVKYKNICADLFKLSKRYGCAVVVAIQANRETRETKDDKGQPFPNLYNVEGSDHPARIATQAFALRQIFDKHVMDIRLEKSRNANNQKPILSYAWDVNTGNMQYLPGDSSEDPMNQTNVPKVQIAGDNQPADVPDFDDFDEDDDVEF